MKIKTIRLMLSWVGCALTGAALITSCSNEDILQDSQKTRNAVEDSMTFSGISQESAATRTIIYDHTKGGGASVIWKETDNILVKDNSGQWRQSATATFPIASKKSNALFSHPLKTIFQHKACTNKLYADSFYKVQKNSHSSFEVICCRS